MWFRALVPSWRFFDRATTSPQLLVQIGDQPWRPACSAPRRHVWSWAFAPAGNLALAYQSTVDHLVAEVDELDESTDHDDPKITGLVDYELVVRIVREQVPSGATWNWKIVRDGEDYLLGTGA